MTENIKAAAFAANLQGEQKQQADDLVRALFVHKELSNMPKSAAEKKYNSLPQDQKTDLKNKFEKEDTESRGWLGNAWHYTGGKVFEGLDWVSDKMTQVYRAVAIPIVNESRLGFDWEEAGKGDKVFNNGRIDKAKAMYGEPAVKLAMRIKSGEDPEKIWATATDEQKKYLMLDDPTNVNIPGVPNVDKARGLWNEVLDTVGRAQFSFGRQVANAILPEQLEKNGLVYTLTSGTLDAAYRFFADPLILASKARGLYAVGKWSVDAVLGGEKAVSYFSKAPVKQFWDEYGKALEELGTAQTAAVKSPKAIAEARRRVEILAPEFGREVVKSFQKAGIKDANTAQAYFMDTEDALKVIKGSAARKRVLMPKMETTIGGVDAKFIPGTRAFRVNLVTRADKIIDIDKAAPSIVDGFYGDPSTTDGIVKSLSEDGKLIGQKLKENQSQKGFARLTSQAIAIRLDKAKAKFNIAPIFKDDIFDVQSVEAPTQVYRLARLVMTKNDAKMISETFDTIEDTGARKEMVKGLWETIAEARGLNLTESGQKVTRMFSGKGDARFSVGNFGDEFQDLGALPSDYSNLMTTPSLIDIDRAAARSGLIGNTLNLANKEWVDKMTGYWSFLTLAGPRYAIRNATEDLMVHLAIGGTPWGLAKGRFLSTRVNTALEAARTSGNWTESPLGAVMQVLNKKEAAKYTEKIKEFETSVKELKALKVKAARTAPDAPEFPALNEKIASLEAATKNGTVDAVRRIVAEALTEGRLNRYRKSVGLKPMFQEESDIIAEHLIYGNLDNSLSFVTEGAFNFATGADYVTRSTLFTRRHGVRSTELIVDDPKARKFAIKRGDKSYKSRSLGAQDDEAMLSWLMRMNYYANDELGAIAVANLSNTEDGKKAAIAKLVDWMEKNPSFRKEAQLAAKGIDEQQHAELVYNRAKEIFEMKGSPTKDVNEELLNKIRIKNKDGEYVISGKISLDDLPTNPDQMPEYILGPALVPISDSGNMTSSIMTKGWTWLGLANARISREPMVIENIVTLRKQMRKSGLEDAYVKSVVSKVDQTDANKVAAATERAKRQYAQLVEDRAVSQVVEYVDNPLIRTQAAFAARNFSRFYRAQEDFYRRMYKVVRYNPAAIRKAALVMDGIDHNGWIQEDDQGEKYFVYPGVEPIYRAVQASMAAVGIAPEFKTPFPVQFGANVKMLTPSLNSDSLLPTFNGPLAGVSIKVLTNLVDVFGAPGAADTITELTMGKYSVDQPFVSSFLPAHINRLYAAMDKDERDSQYASAWRKAVTYLEASGNGIPKKYDEMGNLIPPSIEEQEAYRQKIKNTTLAIVGTRFIYGFIAPASPKVELKSEMANWIKDNDRANFKQGWNALIDEYAGDYDKAMAKWVELFPNQIPFTVTESEKKTVAIIGYAEEAGKFVEDNKGLFEKYPQGAAFLIPQKGGFSWDAYKTMKDMGLKYNKRVDDYLREVQTVADLQTYYSKKNEYEANLELMPTDFARSIAREEFQNWATLFKAGRPMLQEELSQGSQRAIARQNAIDDLRNMLNDKDVKVKPAVRGSLKDMLDLYDNYKVQKETLGTLSGSSNLVSFMKDNTIVEMRELSKKNENTKSAYMTLFASLLGDY